MLRAVGKAARRPRLLSRTFSLSRAARSCAASSSARASDSSLPASAARPSASERRSDSRRCSASAASAIRPSAPSASRALVGDNARPPARCCSAASAAASAATGASPPGAPEAPDPDTLRDGGSGGRPSPLSRRGGVVGVAGTDGAGDTPQSASFRRSSEFSAWASTSCCCSAVTCTGRRSGGSGGSDAAQDAAPAHRRLDGRPSGKAHGDEWGAPKTSQPRACRCMHACMHGFGWGCVATRSGACFHPHPPRQWPIRAPPTLHPSPPPPRPPTRPACLCGGGHTHLGGQPRSLARRGVALGLDLGVLLRQLHRFMARGCGRLNGWADLLYSNP
jgi:hypothetical protein